MRTLVTGEVSADPQHARSRVVGKDHRLFELSLRNGYDELVEAPEAERAKVVRRHARMVLDSPLATKPAATPRLMLKLQPRREHEALVRGFVVRNQAVGTGPGRLEQMVVRDHILRDRLTDDLFLQLSIDHEGAVEGISDAPLEPLHLSRAAAFAQARSNLASRSRGAWRRLADGLYQAPWGDGYDGARIALPELIRELPLRGDPVAVVPNRSCLLVTGMLDAQAHEAFFADAAAAMAADRPVHMQPLRLVGDAWRPLFSEAEDLKLLARPATLARFDSLHDWLDYSALEPVVREELRGRGFADVAPLQRMQESVADAPPWVTVTVCPRAGRVALPLADFGSVVPATASIWNVQATVTYARQGTCHRGCARRLLGQRPRPRRHRSAARRPVTGLRKRRDDARLACVTSAQESAMRLEIMNLCAEPRSS